MENGFKNKVAIVTGAGQGIGRAIAAELARVGVRVVVNDREESLATEVEQALVRDHGIALAVAGDAGDPEFIQQLVDSTIQHFGQLDFVIANAGVTLFGDFFEYTPADFHEIMRVNLGGTFFLTQASANHMRQAGNGGRVIFLSSVTGHQAHKNLAAYGMSKAALELLARTLVIELSPYKITVNALAPGATLTERTLTDPTYEKTWAELTPLGRAATTADIVHAAMFLLSDGASHITGQTLVIDGGWICTSPSPY